MRTKSLLIGAVAVLVLLASAWAADVTGKWVAQMPGRDGATSETTFTLKVEGTALTGTMTTTRGESTISEGKVNGDEISFVIVRKMGENEMKISYERQSCRRRDHVYARIPDASGRNGRWNGRTWRRSTSCRWTRWRNGRTWWRNGRTAGADRCQESEVALTF